MNLENQLPQLDHIDIVILITLAKNSRTSFTDIALRLGVAAGTVHVRVAKLMDVGVIKKNTLEIDYKQLGYLISAYFGITFDFKKGSEAEFKEDLKENYPSILELYSISGKYNFYGKIFAVNLESLNKILDEIRSKKGVIKVEEFICIETLFCDPNRLGKEIERDENPIIKDLPSVEKKSDTIVEKKYKTKK